MGKGERIELHERYLVNGERIEELKEKYEYTHKDAIKYAVYKYRRTNPRIDEIERIIEIPGNKKECRVKFFVGYSITVRENYDDLCIRLNDLENEMSYLWKGN
jgi:hypothetical protein